MIHKTLCVKCKLAKVQITNLDQSYFYAAYLSHRVYLVFVLFFNLCVIMKIMNTLKYLSHLIDPFDQLVFAVLI